MPRRGGASQPERSSPAERYALRPARAADALALAVTVQQGFETYRAFAPADWEPPALADELARLREGLADPDTWALVAEADGEPAGHVALVPARRAHNADLEAGLGHLWQLFVREPHWGSGVAARLLAAAVAEGPARGFTALRLFTPEAQRRARRFYEREGWRLHAPAVHEPHLGFAVVEYRLPLAAVRR